MVYKLGYFIALILAMSCSDVVKEINDRKLNNKPNYLAPSLGPKFSLEEELLCKPRRGKLVQSSCQPGYICVPMDLAQHNGLCLKDCGVNEEGYLKKRDVCDGGQQCMLFKDPMLRTQGLFCAEPQIDKDGRCMTPFDKNACASGLSCLPTASFVDDGGVTFFGLYRCKQECSLDHPCPNRAEKCTYPSYARLQDEHQSQTDHKPKKCSLSGCKQDPALCPCSSELGFSCHELMPGVDRGNCARKLGVCE